MTRPTRYPPELRDRAMRLVREHRSEHPLEPPRYPGGSLGTQPQHAVDSLSSVSIPLDCVTALLVLNVAPSGTFST